jgi:hypothetical protein
LYFELDPENEPGAEVLADLFEAHHLHVQIDEPDGNNVPRSMRVGAKDRGVTVDEVKKRLESDERFKLGAGDPAGVWAIGFECLE